MKFHRVLENRIDSENSEDDDFQDALDWENECEWRAMNDPEW